MLTFPSFDKVQQTVVKKYTCLILPKVMYGFVARHASRKQTKMVIPKYMELPKPPRGNSYSICTPGSTK